MQGASVRPASLVAVRRRYPAIKTKRSALGQTTRGSIRPLAWIDAVNSANIFRSDLVARLVRFWIDQRYGNVLGGIIRADLRLISGLGRRAVFGLRHCRAQMLCLGLGSEDAIRYMVLCGLSSPYGGSMT